MCGEKDTKHIKYENKPVFKKDNTDYLTYSMLVEFYHQLLPLVKDKSLSNKKLIQLVKQTEWGFTKHTIYHLLSLFSYISHKLSSYKSQDRLKLKGDYNHRVLKRGAEPSISVKQPSTSLVKNIHTDSREYIDPNLYVKKYFNIIGLLKLLIDSNGKCFYCNYPFDMGMPDKYLNCNDMSCYYYEKSISLIKKNIHHNSTQRRWTLERINNKLGHYQSNCVVACLGCNIKRGRTNHASFKFTKRLVVYQEPTGDLL